MAQNDTDVKTDKQTKDLRAEKRSLRPTDYPPTDTPVNSEQLGKNFLRDLEKTLSDTASELRSNSVRSGTGPYGFFNSRTVAKLRDIEEVRGHWSTKSFPNALAERLHGDIRPNIQLDDAIKQDKHVDFRTAIGQNPELQKRLMNSITLQEPDYDDLRRRWVGACDYFEKYGTLKGAESIMDLDLANIKSAIKNGSIHPPENESHDPTVTVSFSLSEVRAKYQSDMGKFYEGLSLEQKSLFADPLSPFGGKDKNGRPHVLGILGEFLMEENAQHAANLDRFEKSLTPEQKKHWDGLKGDSHWAGEHFVRPDDGIKPAPSALYVHRPEKLIRIEPDWKYEPPVREPLKIDPETLKILTELKPARDFELTVHKGPGAIPVNDDALVAQKLMNELKKLDPEKLKDIDLGHFGANKDGADGRFGKKTYESVIAMEKYLGIDPPTGKITDELVAKMKEKAAELSPPVRGLERLLERDFDFRHWEKPEVICLNGDRKEIEEMLKGAGINASKIENGPGVMADSGPDSKLDSTRDQVAPAAPKNTTFTV